MTVGEIEVAQAKRSRDSQRDDIFSEENQYILTYRNFDS